MRAGTLALAILAFVAGHWAGDAYYHKLNRDINLRNIMRIANGHSGNEPTLPDSEIGQNAMLWGLTWAGVTLGLSAVYGRKEK